MELGSWRIMLLLLSLRREREREREGERSDDHRCSSGSYKLRYEADDDNMLDDDDVVPFGKQGGENTSVYAL